LEEKIRERHLTFEEFAEFAETFAREHREPGTLSMRHLQRLIAGRGPNGRPLGPVRPATARLLEHIFGISIGNLLAPPSADRPGDTRPGEHVTMPAGAFEWLDDRAGWPRGTSHRAVTARTAESGSSGALDMLMRGAHVGRDHLASELADYYGVAGSTYGVSLGDLAIGTTILTKPGWLDLACPLSATRDGLVLMDELQPTFSLDDLGARRALDRLVQAAGVGVRLTHKPVYRLLSVDVGSAGISGRVGLTPFVEYALTMDLLEDELTGVLAEDRALRPGDLPLRDRYLPDLTSVFDVGGRLCAGGVAGLCAIGTAQR
jgi:hypothetical protein